jgi:hypothetical protein
MSTTPINPVPPVDPDLDEEKDPDLAQPDVVRHDPNNPLIETAEPADGDSEGEDPSDQLPRD